MKQKKSDPIDRHVGSRVRMRRLMLNVSQTRLGVALGITFQQIQKYEKGTNRISASRLRQMSDVLKVPVSFFFDGAPDGEAKGSNEVPEDATGFLATREGLALARAFMRIRKHKLQRHIVGIIEELAGRR